MFIDGLIVEVSLTSGYKCGRVKAFVEELVGPLGRRAAVARG